MRRGLVRAGLLLLLTGVGAAAAVQVRQALTAAESIATGARALQTRVDALQQEVGDLGMLQAAYVAPARDPAAALEGFPPRLRELTAAAAALASASRSAQGAEATREFADALSAAAQADARARDHLLLGDLGSAAHVVFGESEAARARMAAALQTFQVAEADVREAERQAQQRQAALVAGGAGLFWLLGTITLLLLPTRRGPDAPLTIAAAPPIAGVDFAETAALCTEIARVDSPTALEGLLDRAVELLDAPGMVVWMAAGEEMLPVVARGYDVVDAARLHPVRRADDHAAAVAWREGVTQTVAGIDGGNGAIVAPMWSPGGCGGVLAVETRRGREQDPQLRAATELIAAQLSSVVTGSGTPARARATGT